MRKVSPSIVAGSAYRIIVFPTSTLWLVVHGGGATPGSGPNALNRPSPHEHGASNGAHGTVRRWTGLDSGRLRTFVKPVLLGLNPSGRSGTRDPTSPWRPRRVPDRQSSLRQIEAPDVEFQAVQEIRDLGCREIGILMHRPLTFGVAVQQFATPGCLLSGPRYPGSSLARVWPDGSSLRGTSDRRAEPVVGGQIDEADDSFAFPQTY